MRRPWRRACSGRTTGRGAAAGRYGTILCDLEGGRVVDLLPDRCADTPAAWLRERPGVAAVARGRAGAYADGARRGAPDAGQVADRRHLLRNASDALLSVLERHRRALARVAREVGGAATVMVPPEPPDPRPPTKLRELRRRRQAERDARFEEVASRARAGLGAAAIAREIGVPPSTVRNRLRVGAAPTRRQTRRRARLIDPFLPCLVERLREGEGNATRLWREIRSMGFKGRAVGARERIAALKTESQFPEAPRLGTPAWQRPTPRRTAHPVLRGKETSGMNGRFLDALVEAVPEIGRAVGEARAFAALIRDRDQAAPGPWLERCREGPLRTLAMSLDRDRAAVEAALELPWSTSPVEGHTHRPKPIKRAMHGRAGLDLLRARVLAA